MAEIETSVGEFKNVTSALKYFRDTYLLHLDELEKRCMFIEGKNGIKAATIMNWWNYTGSKRDPWIHWMAVAPQYQGLGLGKAIVYKAMYNTNALEGDKDVYLHTQTWSYKAINIYIKAGFKINSEPGLGGYENNDYLKALALLKDYVKYL